MKTHKLTPPYLLLIVCSALLAGCKTLYSPTPNPSELSAQADDSLDHRKGTIIVHAGADQEIKIEQIKHEFWFGAALANQAFDGRMNEEDTARYKAIFLENFNSAVTENALKWLSMQPTSEPVNYATVDAILEWTDANEIPLRGHNIFWGINKFVQPWVKKLNDEALYETVRNRAHDIGSRYKGRFAQYDLNNEMIHGNYYEDRLGEEITLEMANWIKAEDPQAKLYLNDYDILTGSKLNLFLDHIRDLLEQGVPIDGIGVQGHLHKESFDRQALKHALDQLAQFDLPIIVTEFNMPGQRSKYYREKGTHPMTQEAEMQKAKDLTDYYRICFSHTAVDGILMWGFWSEMNWIPESSLYDRDWKSAPALQAYQDLVFKEWRTNESVQSGSDGRVEIPAFFGTYKISVKGESKVVKLKKQQGILEVNF